MRKIRRTAIACMAVLIILVTVQSAAAQGKLQGVWKMTEVTVTGPNAQTITNIQSNLIIITNKHYSRTGIIGNNPRPDLPQKEATDAQKVATWTPFFADAGTYEVKGTTITTKTLVGKNPSQMEPGNFGTADFKIEGNTLTITTKASNAGPVANPITLKLVRLE